MKDEYAPKPRIVVELSRPRILGTYVNGEPTDIPATIRYDDGRGRFWVEFIEGAHPSLPKGVGAAKDIEVVFTDD